VNQLSPASLLGQSSVSGLHNRGSEASQPLKKSSLSDTQQEGTTTRTGVKKALFESPHLHLLSGKLDYVRLSIKT
jgi:hypothetical protein